MNMLAFSEAGPDVRASGHVGAPRALWSRHGPSRDGAGRDATVIVASISAGVAVSLLGPAAAIVAVGGSLLAVSAYAAPGALFAAYLAIPVYKGFVQPHIPVDLTVLLALLNTLQVLYLVGPRRRSLPAGPLLLWGLLAVLVVVGSVYAPSGAPSFATAVSWVALVFMPMLASIRVASSRLFVDQFVATLFGFGVLFAVGGLVVLQSDPSARVVVLNTNTINVAKTALLVPLIGAAYLGTQGYRIRRVTALLVTPFALLTAVGSGARGPVLMGLAVMIPIALWALSRSRGLGKALTAATLTAAGVMIGLAVAPGVPTQALARFDTLLSSVGGSAADAGASVLARQQLFAHAWRMFETSPLVGLGTASFRAEIAADPVLGLNTYPHNIPLEIAASYGLVGVLIVALLVFAAARAQRLGDPTWLAVDIVLVFWLLNGLVSGGFYEERALYGLLLLAAFRPAAEEVRAPGAEPAGTGIPKVSPTRRSRGPDSEPTTSAMPLRQTSPDGGGA